MLPQHLLDILVCPKCKGPLEYHAGETTGDESLVCSTDELRFPVRDGIPIMLLDEAIPA